MEEKLKQAANDLPLPNCKFPVYQQKAVKKPSRKLVLAAALIAVLLLTITGYAFSGQTYFGLVRGISDYFPDAQRNASKFGLTLPETLLDSPFNSTSKSYVAPTGTPDLIAWLFPEYIGYSVDYRIEWTQQLDEHNFITHGENIIHVGFGTMVDEYWKRYFGWFDENSEYTPAGNEVVPGTFRKVEYEGYTIYAAEIDYEYLVSKEIHRQYKARIEDNVRHVCISISAEDLDTAIEAAKVIIDLNKLP